MNEKIKCFFSGFIGGLLLCLGITWGKKNKSGSNSRINSADCGVDLSGLAELVTERNNRNIEKLRVLSSELGSSEQGNGDSERIRELVADLRAEQNDSVN